MTLMQKIFPSPANAVHQTTEVRVVPVEKQPTSVAAQEKLATASTTVKIGALDALATCMESGCLGG